MSLWEGPRYSPTTGCISRGSPGRPGMPTQCSPWSYPRQARCLTCQKVYFVRYPEKMLPAHGPEKTDTLCAGSGVAVELEDTFLPEYKGAQGEET